MQLMQTSEELIDVVGSDTSSKSSEPANEPEKSNSNQASLTESDESDSLDKPNMEQNQALPKKRGLGEM